MDATPLPVTLESTTKEPAAEVAQGVVVLGTVKQTEGSHRVKVSYLYGGKHHEHWAPTTFGAEGSVGRQVALSFLEGDVRRPLAVGLIYSALYSLLEAAPESTAREPAPAPQQRAVTIDGQTVTLKAAQTLELKCGDASITLTNDGKILIRGEYVQSRARGVNRILGGSVQVN